MPVNDTIHTNDTSLILKDTVFIPEYLNKNPLYISSNSDNNISCRQYILSVVKDSELKQKEKPTLFKEKTFYRPNLAMQPRENAVSYDWIFGIFMFIVLLTAILIRFGGNMIFSFLQGCFSKPQVAITTKDGSSIHPLTLLPVVFILLPVISFLIYCGINYFDAAQYLKGFSLQVNEIIKHPFLLWIAVYVCSIVVYFFKILLIKFFSWVFKAKKVSNYYVQVMLNFGILTGFCLILPTFFAVYSPSFYEGICLSLSLFVFVLLFVMRLFRCFFVIIDTFKFSHVYLFFYLCTVEFLPLIVILKILFF